MRLFGTSRINNNGELIIGECNTRTLKEKYGTPLYIMDESNIRERCRLFNNGLQSKHIETEVIYASKAFLTVSMCKLIEEEGLSLDVVSGGELYTAIQSSFPQERLYMHGNNKTNIELKMALEYGVGRIIVDNYNEADRIEALCQTMNTKADVMLRVNPGISAHTHEYIKTTENTSKFGESIYSDQTIELINAMNNSEYLNFHGFHSHIGSQIFDENSFLEEVSTLLSFIHSLKSNHDITVKELNLGGGFGIYYTSNDREMDIELTLKMLLGRVKGECERLDIETPKLLIEPGRAIVANAGTTLYEVGSVKETYGGKNYVFVDGSMNDNIRTALYEADYEAALANKMNGVPEKPYTITGKCCESGDIIVRQVLLPTPERNDLLAVFSTGAYNYSMASNYNRLPRPAVVFVKDGKSKLVVKRETYDDLIQYDLDSSY
ncbi:diaminopimelate decarboxylase [Haloplasma contractile]|uniref:Diaminopimelate decarboxylase n=1 Tax=Haloplasma contractile SSD-17B TaxID=1033810 RepID=U2EBN4_9MOLU|nr:diaminopimelate decarboxylase [Haloplasma contractile]ERJ12478.1 Diaminopimelate decarboxylase protein [Haloplasma contractile SSD-17B]